MERSNSFNLAVVTGTICLLFSTPTLWADITNGGFSDGLNGWTPVGVEALDGEAVFAEEKGSPAIFYLEQAIDVEAGLQLLSFDIFIESPIGGETDRFDVTLGSSNIYHWENGNGPLPWTTITHHINSTGSQDLKFALTPDFNASEQPWTLVKLDNVKLTPVPGALLLGMIGLSVAGVKLHKRA